jgi:hypothetical protein
MSSLSPAWAEANGLFPQDLGALGWRWNVFGPGAGALWQLAVGRGERAARVFFCVFFWHPPPSPSTYQIHKKSKSLPLPPLGTPWVQTGG